MAGPVEESSRIVKYIVECGAFDDIRKNIFEDLKTNAGLREYVMQLVGDSKALKDRRSKKELLEELQTELKDKLVDRACRTVWEILASDGKVAKDVELKVHEAICHVHEEKIRQQQAAAPAVKPEPGGAGDLPGFSGPPPPPGAAVPSASLPPRAGPSGASLAGLPYQQQQQHNRPPARHYGVYG